MNPTQRNSRTRPAPTAAPAPRGGYLWLVFPAILGLSALGILLSGRDLTQAFDLLDKEVEGFIEVTRHPVMAWVQRAVSLLLIAASLERIASHFLHRRFMPSAVLTLTFLLFWLTNVAFPGLLGARPQVSHEFAYSLLFGIAASLCSPDDRERILAASRNALFVFVLAGAVLVPLNPAMVLDSSYSQGLLPGVPRFGGLASHPVGMGMLTQTALLLLWVRPFRRRWLNVAAWLLGLSALFLAQSKTAWLAFLISAACLMLVRRLPNSVASLGDPRSGSSSALLLCFGVIGAMLAVLFGVLVADVPGLFDDFFSTSQGAQLVSMTGRDRIWIVAIEEWRNNPVFGFGPTIWDAEYRQAIGMPFATHAHNQFVDTLARCGTVGFIGLVVYALVLLVQSVRYARATGGLTLAMCATIALQSISEVPLMLFGYGTDLFTHLLLVVTLAGAAAERARAPQPSPMRMKPTPYRSVA